MNCIFLCMYISLFVIKWCTGGILQTCHHFNFLHQFVHHRWRNFCEQVADNQPEQGDVWRVQKLSNELLLISLISFKIINCFVFHLLSNKAKINANVWHYFTKCESGAIVVNYEFLVVKMM